MLGPVPPFQRAISQDTRVAWISPDIAIGKVTQTQDWQSMYDEGVRAVVDVRNTPENPGSDVRRHGMRYLKIGLRNRVVPAAAEMQIVASWVLDRLAEDGRVFIQDGHCCFNDGLIAVASLVKGGLPVGLALQALCRAMPGRSLDCEQHSQLIKFSAAQVAV